MAPTISCILHAFPNGMVSSIVALPSTSLLTLRQCPLLALKDSASSQVPRRSKFRKKAGNKLHQHAKATPVPFAGGNSRRDILIKTIRTVALAASQTLSNLLDRPESVQGAEGPGRSRRFFPAVPPRPNSESAAGAMRVFLISDVHTDYDENLEWLRDLSPTSFQNDALIVAGDVSDSIPKFEETFRIIRPKFAHVFFTPGNHDLWVRTTGLSPNPTPKPAFEPAPSPGSEQGADVTPDSASKFASERDSQPTSNLGSESLPEPDSKPGTSNPKPPLSQGFGQLESRWQTEPAPEDSISKLAVLFKICEELGVDTKPKYLTPSMGSSQNEGGLEPGAKMLPGELNGGGEGSVTGREYNERVGGGVSETGGPSERFGGVDFGLEKGGMNRTVLEEEPLRGAALVEGVPDQAAGKGGSLLGAKGGGETSTGTLEGQRKLLGEGMRNTEERDAESSGNGNTESEVDCTPNLSDGDRGQERQIAGVERGGIGNGRQLATSLDDRLTLAARTLESGPSSKRTEQQSLKVTEPSQSRAALGASEGKVQLDSGVVRGGERFEGVSDSEQGDALGRERGGVERSSAGVWVVPILSWHHISFDTEPDIPGYNIPPIEKVAKDHKVCKWPPGWDPRSESVADEFDKLNLELHREFELGTTPGADVITFSHFLPRLELIPEKRFLFYPNLAKAVGSHALEARVRSIHKWAGSGTGCHLFGHTHFNWDMTLEGIRYIQAPLAYPRERKRRMNGGEDWLPLCVYDSSRGGILTDELPCHWSDYYKTHSREPDNFEFAPWVANLWKPIKHKEAANIKA